MSGVSGESTWSQVRYIPTDLQQLFEKDKVTFYYYYDQVHIYGTHI